MESFEGKSGLEIGGPSRFFQAGEHLPVYPRIAALDNCNYANSTVWEGALSEGDFRLADRIVGRQYICEATAVGSRLAGRTYDFVISSNCLEHVANPLAAIESWLSVLRLGGTLLVVVPHQLQQLRSASPGNRVRAYSGRLPQRHRRGRRDAFQ